MNKVMISGHICADLELKMAGENKYVRFSVGITRKNKKEDGTRDSDFPSCVAWNKRAEVLAEYFHKGSPVNIVGRLQTGSYEGADGKKIYTTDIIVEDFDFLEKKSSRPAPEYTDEQNGKQVPQNEYQDMSIKTEVQQQFEYTDDDMPF